MTTSAGNELVLPITGISGVGKDTLVQTLIRRHPERYRKFVSTTTRAPRPGEVDGVDYNFVSNEQFDSWLAEDRMIMPIEFAGARYGTLRSEIEGHGKVLLMPVVESVAIEIKQTLGARVRIMALDIEEAEAVARMTGRGDSQEKIEERIEADRARRDRIYACADVTIMARDIEGTADTAEMFIADFQREIAAA